jgi:hypothetical protein
MSTLTTKAVSRRRPRTATKGATPRSEAPRTAAKPADPNPQWGTPDAPYGSSILFDVPFTSVGKISTTPTISV